MMSIEELKKNLTHVVPFPDKEFDILMSKGENKSFKARSTIVKKGTVDRHVYLVREGIVRGVYRSGGREHTFYFGFPGDFVASTGSLSLDRPAIITIEAVDDTVVTALSPEDLIRMGSESHAFMRWLFEWFCGQIYTIERKRTILTGTAAERYDALIEGRPELIRRVSVKAIASYLGINEDSLSRLRNPKYRSDKKKSEKQ